MGWQTKSAVGVCNAAYSNQCGSVPDPPLAESEFLLEIDPEPAREGLTSYGGAAVLLRTLRSHGVAQGVARHIHIQQRDRG